MNISSETLNFDGLYSSEKFNQFKESYLNNKFYHLIERTNVLNQMNKIFKEKQYVVLHGESGNGKSTLACQFAHQSQGLYIIWIDSSFFANILIALRESLDALELQRPYVHDADIVDLCSNMDDKVVIDYFKRIVNKHYHDLSFLFIFDNLVHKKDIEQLTTGFNSNIKIIITTKNKATIDDFNFNKIHIDLFSKEECIDLIQKQDSIESLFSSDQWNNILDLFQSDKISPLRLSQLLIALNKHKYCNVRDFIWNKFKHVKRDFYEAYCVLPYLVYLDCDKLSDIILDRIFRNFSNDILYTVLDYLVESNFIRQQSASSYSMNELTQLELAHYFDEDDNKLRAQVMNAITSALNQELKELDISFSKGFYYPRVGFLLKQANLVMNIEWAGKYLINDYDMLLSKLQTLKVPVRQRILYNLRML